MTSVLKRVISENTYVVVLNEEEVTALIGKLNGLSDAEETGPLYGIWEMLLDAQNGETSNG